MSVETWGQLAKSQIDAETVEEAINRIVAQHESDPDAHLGAGESIAVHRAQDIIDHPAGSILADKWTFSENEFTTTFESLAGFYTVGSVDQIWPGVSIEPVSTAYAGRGELQVDGESGQLAIDFAEEQMFQVIFSADTGGDARNVCGFFGDSITNIKTGFGFEIIGTTMNFFASNQAGTVFNTLAFPAFEALQTYIVRMHYSHVDGFISCYVDGVLIGTLHWPAVTWTGYAVLRFISIKPVTTSAVLRIKSLYFRITKARPVVLLDSYYESTSQDELYMAPVSGLFDRIGNTFRSSNNVNLTKIDLFLMKLGLPSGNCRLKIYASSGAYGSGASPVGDYLAVSQNVPLLSLSGSFTLTSFNFTGANEIVLQANTPYYFVLECSGGGQGAYLIVHVWLTGNARDYYARDFLSQEEYSTILDFIMFKAYGKLI